MLQAGDKAPLFTLPDQTGAPVSLESFRGKKVVVYFYPKDNTPGCTLQAKGFRDLAPQIEATGAVLLGISADSEASHEKFAAKHELPFRLLADPERKALEAYGVWKEKSLYGKTFLGIQRSTFLIDENGVIEKVWEKANPTKNPGEVLAALTGQ